MPNDVVLREAADLALSDDVHCFVSCDPIDDARSIPAGITGLTWIVERSFAWLGRNRRMSKDYEYNVQASETMADLATLSRYRT